MTNKIDGGAAFPQSGYEQWAPEGGMTLRDYFAAQAMNRFTYLDITNASSEGYGEFDFGAAAYKAYLYADAMLEARNK